MPDLTLDITNPNYVSEMTLDALLETPSRPLTGIGSQEDNRQFLAWLEVKGDRDMIAKGCCLCREIGHPFTQGCLL